jgi:hypothetical protein
VENGHMPLLAPVKKIATEFAISIPRMNDFGQTLRKDSAATLATSGCGNREQETMEQLA